MENKITVSALSAMIALATGQPGELCEKFLKELFTIIAATLEAGENVRIKGLGTFKIVEIESRKSVDVASGEDIEIPAHKRVIFVPCKELAAIVNAPFEVFEAEEVADDLPTDELMIDYIDDDDDEEDSVMPDPKDEAKSEADSHSEATSDLEEGFIISFADNSGSAYVEESDPATIADSSEADVMDEFEELVEGADSQESIKETEGIKAREPFEKSYNGDEESEPIVESGDESEERDDDPEEQEEQEEERKSGRFGRGFLFGFISAVAVVAVLLIAGMKLGYISSDSLHKSGISQNSKGVVQDNDTKQVAVARQDSISLSNDSDSLTGTGENTTSPVAEEVPTRPSDENRTDESSVASPKYDTVSTTRYLTTMAQEHYGNYNLWPVIYKENQAILGHPDRIKPGTKVVVPPLSKYNIDPANPEDVAAMKREGAKIYAKFKKKV